jgi:hypothetical protein
MVKKFNQRWGFSDGKSLSELIAAASLLVLEEAADKTMSLRFRPASVIFVISLLSCLLILSETYIC